MPQTRVAKLSGLCKITVKWLLSHNTPRQRRVLLHISAWEHAYAASEGGKPSGLPTRMMLLEAFPIL